MASYHLHLLLLNQNMWPCQRQWNMGCIFNVLLKELGYKPEKVLHSCDNMDTITLVNNPSFYLKSNTSTSEFIWYMAMLSMAMFLSPTYDWTAKSLISLWSLLILNNMPRTSYILDMGLVSNGWDWRKGVDISSGRRQWSDMLVSKSNEGL